MCQPNRKRVRMFWRKGYVVTFWLNWSALTLTVESGKKM